MATKLYNKLEDNFHLSNKKALFLNMKLYYEAMGKDIFGALPVTFHVKEGVDSAEWNKFKAYYDRCENEVREYKERVQQAKENGSPVKDIEPIPQSMKKNIWIIKPGENTNCGNGIQVAKDFDDIVSLVSEATMNKKRTCIIQKYIHNPLLVNKRKFDVRLFTLITSINGSMKAYFYEEGYLRTSCREFSLNNLSNRMVHLTNDAVQKKAEDYGKFEPGNKLSY
jgi:tubulin monoglycylase TTLL3/8